MEKFRYGTKEIVATVISVALIVYLKSLENLYAPAGTLAGQIFEWFAPRIVIVAITASLFGPIAGMISGLGGDLLIYVIFGVYAGYPEMFVLGLYGFFMGLYFGKMHYSISGYTAMTFIDFNAIQIMFGIIASVILLPLVKFLSEDVSLYDSIEAGAKFALGNSVVISIVCPLILMTVSAIISSKEDKKKAYANDDENL